ncbi:hypothetical protein D0868_02331 [Hortaea werneckii]|uniref:DUF1989 domain-containing protein n=1 Tax=Hortaea werneckii TaxID=91943 RepID=A0A3M6ZC47_HORWE|nr:hypothetical protein D0868_02331 [Hortaea werneckii]
MASAESANAPPPPAYQATPGSILHADKEFYTSVAEAGREQIESFVLPIRSGRAWKVPAGAIVRISTPEGPQVGDLNIWRLDNPRERFWASRTRQLHASHLSTFDRLWSCLPYLRPLCTIIADSLSGYGVDHFGGRCHDLLGTRCDPYITGLNDEGKYFMEACPAKKGDFIEFFAEQPLLMALSTCPGGDLSAWSFGEGGGGEEGDGGERKGMLDCCRPLKVEVFRLKDDSVLRDWSEPSCPKYSGMHGLTVPSGEASSK